MICEACNSGPAIVIDSRKIDDRVWRRRKCIACGNRWTTWEEKEKIVNFVQYCDHPGCKRPINKRNTLCDIHSQQKGVML